MFIGNKEIIQGIFRYHGNQFLKIIVHMISFALATAFFFVDTVQDHKETAILYYNSQLFTVLGNGTTSRILPIPVKYITQRSKPRPKPACLAEPYFLKSK